MAKLVEKIEMIPDLEFTGSASAEEIKEAQEKLAIQFPNDFLEYLKKFGVISFSSREWKGLNGPDYLDVVESTKEAREMYPDFPVNMFILEDLGIDGILILIDTNGSVFEWQYGLCKKIYSNISEYLEECLGRNN